MTYPTDVDPITGKMIDSTLPVTGAFHAYADIANEQRRTVERIITFWSTFNAQVGGFDTIYLYGGAVFLQRDGITVASVSLNGHDHNVVLYPAAHAA